jgi:hypothetical protein
MKQKLYLFETANGDKHATRPAQGKRLKARRFRQENRDVPFVLEVDRAVITDIVEEVFCPVRTGSKQKSYE